LAEIEVDSADDSRKKTDQKTSADLDVLQGKVGCVAKNKEKQETPGENREN